MRQASIVPYKPALLCMAAAMYAPLCMGLDGPPWCCAVVEAQNQLTQTVLAQCETRDEFKELMTRLYNYERYGCPYKCVFCHLQLNSGLQPLWVGKPACCSTGMGCSAVV